MLGKCTVLVGKLSAFFFRYCLTMRSSQSSNGVDRSPHQRQREKLENQSTNQNQKEKEMNRKLFIATQVVLSALLMSSFVASASPMPSASGSGAATSGNVKQIAASPDSPMAPVGSAFNYQGFLSVSGN